MAGITLEWSEQAESFAESLAEAVEAEVIAGEMGENIVIEGKDGGDLTIPRWCWNETMAGDGEREEQRWHSLIFNRDGEAEVTPQQIIVRDPKRAKGYHLRFDSLGQKDEAMRLAETLGYSSFREFLITLIESEQERWKEELRRMWAEVDESRRELERELGEREIGV